jgi:hypothetical protein
VTPLFVSLAASGSSSEERQMATDIQAWEAELTQIEEAVNAAEGDGLRARWDSGHYLLAKRVGKQLPRGMRAILTDGLKVHGSEITARMKFAEKSSTNEALANVVSKFKTWHRIKQEALTTTPREKKPSAISPLARLLDRFLEFDQAELMIGDDDVLTRWESEFHAHIQRLRKGMKCLDVPRLLRRQRFPGGAQLAGGLFHLLQTPGEHDPHVIEETARQALAYQCDVEGEFVDEPSNIAVQRFKSEYLRLLKKLKDDDGYLPKAPGCCSARRTSARPSSRSTWPSRSARTCRGRGMPWQTARSSLSKRRRTQLRAPQACGESRSGRDSQPATAVAVHHGL